MTVAGKFVAPADGKAPRFSGFQKFFMVLGVLVIVGGIVTTLLGAH